MRRLWVLSGLLVTLLGAGWFAIPFTFGAEELLLGAVKPLHRFHPPAYIDFHLRHLSTLSPRGAT